MLWWADLAYNLLTCVPFTDAPELLHVPLPSVDDELPADPANYGLYRYVKVSGGGLRHVQIHSSPNAPVVIMWALVDPSCARDRVHEQSYMDTTLPQSIPAIALLHPIDLENMVMLTRSLPNFSHEELVGKLASIDM